MPDDASPSPVEILKAAADATTGPGTPDAATVVSAPSTLSLRALVLAGPTLSAMICWIVLIISGVGIGFGGLVFWPGIPWPESVAPERIQGLMAIAMSLCGILGVIVFRLASGNLKRAEVKVGPAGITVDGGDA